MNSYLDLKDIDTRLLLCIELEPIGTPTATVIIDNREYNYTRLTEYAVINQYIDLLTTFDIDVTLSNKHYTTEYETAVIIKRLSIDNIDIIPQYDYLAQYQNDHNNNNPTSYLGFNGKWTLTIDRPFYQWLHQAQGQGWLLT